APTETHYGVLGIGPRATSEQVERAYRHAAGLYDEDSLATYSLLDSEERQQARARGGPPPPPSCAAPAAGTNTTSPWASPGRTALRPTRCRWRRRRLHRGPRS